MHPMAYNHMWNLFKGAELRKYPDRLVLHFAGGGKQTIYERVFNVMLEADYIEKIGDTEEYEYYNLTEIGILVADQIISREYRDFEKKLWESREKDESEDTRGLLFGDLDDDDDD